MRRGASRATVPVGAASLDAPRRTYTLTAGMATAAHQSTTIRTLPASSSSPSSRPPSLPPRRVDFLFFRRHAFDGTGRRDKNPPTGRRVRMTVVRRGQRCAGTWQRRRRTRRQRETRGRCRSRSRGISGRRRRFRQAMGNGRRPDGRPPRNRCSVLLDDPGSSRSPDPHFSAHGPDAFSGAAMLRRLRSDSRFASPALAQSFGGSRCGG